MKKYILFLAALLFSAAPALAVEPDLHGEITSIDYGKSEIQVRNILPNKIGNRDYRVNVKQGMINDFKRNDTVNVWLMEDGKEAGYIELESR